MKSASEIAHYSPLTVAAMMIFNMLKRLSGMGILAMMLPIYRPRSGLTEEEIASREFVMRRARAIEYYVLGWLAIEITVTCAVLFSHPRFDGFAQWVSTGLVALRITEIIQVTVNAALFDQISSPIGRRVATPERMLVIAAVNFIELYLCFSAIYGMNVNLLTPVSGPDSAFYFSAITQLTIGYGDIAPTGWLRAVAPAHGFLSFLFVALVFSRFIASMKPLSAVLEDTDTK